MTRQQLEAVVDALVEIVDGWNDAMVEDDRGRGDRRLCLTLHDDGSGTLGEVREAWIKEDMCMSHVEDFHEFRDLDELVKVLSEGEYVELDEEYPAEALLNHAILMMVTLIRRIDRDDPVRKKACDWLVKKDLMPSPLREEPTP